MLVGSAPGLGFGCRIEPVGCPALVIGGTSTSFHCSLENLMIWPRGAAPDHLISIDNSYSVTFRNIRIHEAQNGLKRAALLLLGDAAAGGHGPCANIIWDNVIIRNDSGQPPIAILAARGCGSHRFIAPDLENYQVLLEWQGGQLDLLAPYTERAGRYAVNCDPHIDDHTAYLNTFGGTIDSAKSGLGCAIRETTRNFNSFGTLWGATSGRAAYVYSLPPRPITFHGTGPFSRDTGGGIFSGVSGWRDAILFPQLSVKRSRSLQLVVPAHDQRDLDISLPGVSPGTYWARVMFNLPLSTVQLTAHVRDQDTVTIAAYNLGNKEVRLNGTVTIECGPV
jgi:hypothetical protein